VRIHHLNCGSMCPANGALINGSGWLKRGRMVCHVLLIETGRELILVDTGFGTGDIANPSGRVGRGLLLAAMPKLLREETALAQVERLGFRREDVRHIVPTHLDADHIGGLSDFPEATVHAFAGEHAAAMARATSNERYRYRPLQWAHGPRWDLLSTGGDKWLGFDSVRAASEDVLLIPLHGHTRGHCGVAVKDGAGWLLHCGDAYFHESEVLTEPRCPIGLRIFQRALAVDVPAWRNNRERLRTLKREHPEVRIFSAHDAAELANFAVSA
jgi:glyoxylase-like metal-dependent hydrolase (beta-lactamase superfamily II)